MKKILLSALVASCLCACGDKEVSYEIIKNDLRAPAYPLVTIDPYTSAWSMSDNLYDGPVCHWTGKPFPFIGVVKVDGVPYRFMGTEDQEMVPIVPTSQQADWTGRYTTDKPSGDWTAFDYNDSRWKSDRGAFGTMENEPTAKTQWGTRNIWVRRTVNIDQDLTNYPVYLEFSNDDDAIFYINGVQAYSTGSTCNKNKQVKISDEARAALRQGTNVLAAECVNPVGNGLLDFGLLIPKELKTAFGNTAVQTSADVQATQTHYAFTCGNVDLKVTFSAPLFMDDLELLSRPVNYLTYNVTSRDGQAHDVELYFEASPRWALDQPYQACASRGYEEAGMVFLKSGSKEQNILAKQGDDLRIDWGYFYLMAAKENTQYGIGGSNELRNAFLNGEAGQYAKEGEDGAANMALVRSYGKVKKLADKILLGYDDLYSIQYFGQNLRPYWNRTGNKTFKDEVLAAVSEYDNLMARCYAFDKQLMQETAAVGGKEYAELCALAYRHSIAAHKLVEAPNGDLLWLSKENNSNGCINTVDLTYPSAPLYLVYNPDLEKGMMNGIFYYSESGKWTKPFAAHDLGTYPLANGQVYGGDMPVEESGNMLILAAAIAAVEGNADYAAKHWEVLTTWTDYLVEKGLDPENQLCTDDFAGHFAHNANLSIKAILGVASYGRLAEMQGKKEIAEQYLSKAREMAAEWERMANDGDHYRLTFDKPGTWSQKYNIVWDKLLGLNIFDPKIAATEVPYYLTKQNIYGLPLDSRETYTKTDWVMWTACMAPDLATFRQFIAPIHKFMNETIDRVPMSDWVFTDKPNYRGFKARSVVGGYYLRLLENKLTNK